MKVPTNVFYSDAQVNVGTIKLTNINNNKCQITFVWPGELGKKISICITQTRLQVANIKEMLHIK